MATAYSSNAIESGSGRKLGIVRLLLAGGVTSGIVFVLCWLGTFLTFSNPTHAYIGLFTPATVSSLQALAEGTLWSTLFGALVGALFAAVYNLFAGLDRA